MFGDWRIDHALGAEFLQQPLRDLVGALIFRDLLAHDEDIGIAPHLLGHGIAQRLADGHCHHLGTLGHLWIGFDNGLRSRRRLLFFSAARCWHSRFGLCRRRGFGGLLLFRRRCCLAEIGGTLAIGQDGRDRRVDRDVGGAFRDQDLAQRALIGRLDFHRRLVGFDLGDDIA